MQGRTFAGMVLVAVLAVGGGVAQGPPPREKPVWTMEFIKVKPGMFGMALGSLDDDWMRVREEAKRRGAVLNYHRIAELSGPQGDGNIVLLTEYKSQATYDVSERLFESIRDQLPKSTSGLLRPPEPEDLYSTVNTRVLQDYSEMDHARFRLLAAN